MSSHSQQHNQFPQSNFWDFIASVAAQQAANQQQYHHQSTPNSDATEETIMGGGNNHPESQDPPIEPTPEAGPSGFAPPPPPSEHEHEHEHPRGWGRQHRRGGGHHHGHHHGGHGGPPGGCGGGFRGRGGFGGRGRGGFPHGGPHGHPFAGNPWAGAFVGPDAPFDLERMARFFSNQFGGQFDQNNSNNRDASGPTGDEGFNPEVDVFDTEFAYLVHVSLPGAKKEDVAVNWDAENSELQVSGVMHRPGDEETLKALALDERKTGLFDRKITLGSRASPAQIYEDAISAKLEDGILKVYVPKEEKTPSEVRKINVN